MLSMMEGKADQERAGGDGAISFRRAFRLQTLALTKALFELRGEIEDADCT